MAVQETLWSGFDTPKLYINSGQFTSTVRVSLVVSSIDTAPQGLSWDGVNTLWCGNAADKLYSQSGRVTSTLKTSLSIGAINSIPTAINADINQNVPWSGYTVPRTLFLTSGKFSTTLKTSLDVSGVGWAPHGNCFDSVDSLISDFITAKLYKTSGQFTTTVKESIDVGLIDLQPTDGIFDGTNTPWCGNSADKLYLQSGYLTSTLKTSLSIPNAPRGVDVDDYLARQGIPGFDPNHNPNPGGGGGRPTTSRGRILTALDDRKLRDRIEIELSEVEKIKIDTAAMSRALDIIFREVEQEKVAEKARQEERITQIIRETISFEHKQRGVKEQLAAIEQLRKDVSKGNKDIEALIALLLARLL